MSIAVAMIAAVAENRVIGKAGGLPWRIPSDMAFFRRTTMGKPIVMGRKQFETVGKPLPGRTNIVVSRQPGYQPDGVLVIDDLAAAVEHAKVIAKADSIDEVVVIGGGEIYRAAMPHADRLYISHVAMAPDGDVLFPLIDPGEWKVIAEPEPPADPRDEASYAVKLYERWNPLKR